MKRIPTAALLTIALTIAAHADVTNTSWYAGYVYVPATATNAGDTGLTVGTGYACFPQTNMYYATTNACAGATAGTDVRAVVHSLLKTAFISYTADVAASDRPVGFIVTEGSSYDPTDTGDLTMTYKVTVTIVLPTTPGAAITYPID